MNSPDALMLQFLQWISLRRRTYSDVMEAWRSSCPRLTVWEDALESGLVEVQGTHEQSDVVLTARGADLLAKIS
jgi:hypothetical protein